MSGVYTVPDFGPSDLMTSDIEGERRLKTEAVALASENQTLAELLVAQLSLIASNQNLIIKELQLMNARIEEAFETDIDGEHL